jgi:hypothetical protein
MINPPREDENESGHSEHNAARIWPMARPLAAQWLFSGSRSPVDGTKMAALWPGEWSPTRRKVEVRFHKKGPIHMTDRMFPSEPTSPTAPRGGVPWLVGITVAILILIVPDFAAIRLSVDVPSLTAGTLPDDPYAARFVRHHG